MTNSIVKPCDYDIEQLTFNPLLSNKKKSAQTILLPSYNGSRSPMIQLPEINLDMYGIPSKCDFYKEDWQRMFLKLPLNQKNPEVKDLTVNFLMKLDVKISSMNFKDLGIGGKGKILWKYQPIVRCTISEDGTPNPDKHSYMKIKLTTEYPTSNHSHFCDTNKPTLMVAPPLRLFAYNPSRHKRASWLRLWAWTTTLKQSWACLTPPSLVKATFQAKH